MTSANRLWSAAVLVALCSILVAVAGIHSGQADVTPQPVRTAYVDFLSLLKDDYQLGKHRGDIEFELQLAVAQVERDYKDKIDAQSKRVSESNPESPERREAITRRIELESERRYSLRLRELAAQGDLRRHGIEAFTRLRTLTNNIAGELGYDEVLNIVRKPEEVVGKGDDFQQLQQQLLISPVLVFNPAYDITDKVLERAKELWDPGITLGEIGVSQVTGTEEEPQKGASIPRADDPEHEDGVFEIRLGQKAWFSVDVQRKGEPAEGESARLRWTRNGIGTGQLADDTGFYTAPTAFPEGNDTFQVTARSVADPRIFKVVTVRLLDADGNRRGD